MGDDRFAGDQAARDHGRRLVLHEQGAAAHRSHHEKERGRRLALTTGEHTAIDHEVAGDEHRGMRRLKRTLDDEIALVDPEDLLHLDERHELPVDPRREPLREDGGEGASEKLDVVAEFLGEHRAHVAAKVARSTFTPGRGDDGSNIDDPGNLYANLLLMGDREAATGKLGSIYDNRWGAGRLRMRMTNEEGLDYPESPAGYPIYLLNEACVDHQSTYIYQVNGGNTLNNDLDALKMVAYWYDPGFTAGSPVDDIDIYVREIGGNVLQHSISSTDNKERVFIPDVGNKAVQVEITGFNVTGNVTGCGTNSMRVHWAMIIEDSDRYDADNKPYWNPTTCQGIAKESA